MAGIVIYVIFDGFSVFCFPRWQSRNALAGKSAVKRTDRMGAGKGTFFTAGLRRAEEARGPDGPESPGQTLQATALVHEA